MNQLISHYVDSDYNPQPLPIPRSEELRAYIAECADFDSDFTLFLRGEMIDASGKKVPSLSDLLLLNPALIGNALAWIVDNQD